MRLPMRTASASSRRCMVVALKGPGADGAGSGAACAQGPRPQHSTAAPRTLFMRDKGPARLASAGAAQVRWRVVAGGALHGLVDLVLLVAQAHGDVAARL